VQCNIYNVYYNVYISYFNLGRINAQILLYYSVMTDILYIDCA